MAIYTRPQILVLLAILATVGIGLAVGEWRRGYPELVERMERIEHAGGDETPETVPAVTAGPREAGGDGATRLRGQASSGRAGDDPGRWRTSPRADKTGPSREGAGAPVDLNAAVLEDLVRLPGVGTVLAGRILEARDAARFASIEDLRRVRGLGRAKIERLRPYLTVAADGAGGPERAVSPPERPAPPLDAVPAPDDVAPSADDG